MNVNEVHHIRFIRQNMAFPNLIHGQLLTHHIWRSQNWGRTYTPSLLPWCSYLFHSHSTCHTWCCHSRPSHRPGRKVSRCNKEGKRKVHSLYINVFLELGNISLPLWVGLAVRHDPGHHLWLWSQFQEVWTSALKAGSAIRNGERKIVLGIDVKAVTFPPLLAIATEFY